MTTFLQEAADQSQDAANQTIEIKDSGELIWDQLAGWYNSFIAHLPNIAIAIVVLIAAYFISKYVDRGIQRLLSSKVSQASVRRLAGKAVAIVVVLGGIFIAMSVLQLNDAVQGIIAGAGISGLVIGLALQGSMSNVISGIILSFRKQVRVGDWIETTDYAGEVMEIQLDKFILKQADNNLVIIPNKTIIDNPMKNFTLTPRMRVVVSCGVGYKMDLELCKKLTIDTLSEKFPQNDGEEVEFYYQEFGDSSINFITRFWVDAVKNRQNLQAQSDAVLAIKKVFDANDINIPFPIRTLEFNNKLQMDGTATSKEDE
ncbi:small conductance mechanosensitive channel [Nonlabens sp. Hel1_33_55]|uniref:mechanosensitive ion channel family protein n=1 Tax=Nonlabens sp. Hel1_33_55 TaxID=1336802 RepID=UPI000875E1FE|nr:mechanosensitive ion channel family protein [Nonlabens sp. Hel1_33_55]SCY24449.1 small conductance mechanosensitive channel [Nonlabens sp. Hel1_33_55]